MANLSPHSVLLVIQILAKHSIRQVRSPPYSPDNCNFLFPRLKESLEDKKTSCGND